MASYPGVPVTVVSGSLGTISNGGGSVAVSSTGVVTITFPTNQAATFILTDGVTNYDVISSQTGATATAVRTFTPPPVTVAGAAGVTYSNLTLAAATLTLTGAVGVTALNGTQLNLAQITVTDATALTVTTASTLYVAGAPIASGAGPVTITNNYAVHIAAGLLRAQGGATIDGAAVQVNVSSNFNTSINTGTSTGTISIGNNAAGNVAIASGGIFTNRAVGGVLLNHATAAINSSATMTGPQAATGYITSTSGAATTITFPTGTTLGGQLGAVQGTVFYIFIDNTAGANTITMAVNTNAVLSDLAVAASASFGRLTIIAGATGLACYCLIFSSATAYTITRMS